MRTSVMRYIGIAVEHLSDPVATVVAIGIIAIAICHITNEVTNVFYVHVGLH